MSTFGALHLHGWCVSIAVFATSTTLCMFDGTGTDGRDLVLAVLLSFVRRFVSKSSFERTCAVDEGVPWTDDMGWKRRRGCVARASMDESTRAGEVSCVLRSCRTSACDVVVDPASNRRPSSNQSVSSLLREETPMSPRPIHPFPSDRLPSIRGGEDVDAIVFIHRYHGR